MEKVDNDLNDDEYLDDDEDLDIDFVAGDGCTIDFTEALGSIADYATMIFKALLLGALFGFVSAGIIALIKGLQEDLC